METKSVLTRYLGVGHAPSDLERDRRLKSIFALVMICVVVLNLDYVMFREQTVLELLIDGLIFLAAFMALLVLHLTRRHDWPFMLFAGLVIPVFVVEMLISGNRHGGLFVFAVLPLWAIPMLGPRRSLPWFAVSVVAVLFVAVSDPFLPHIESGLHKSAGNPMGWLFHAPLKERVGQDEATTFIVVAVLLYMIMFSAQRALIRANERIESLLVNVLPPSIAARLTEGDDRDFSDKRAAIADAHDQATILFADIVGFTQLASNVSPAELVTLLDRVFGEFDDLAQTFNVEKIKTIGDAYMAVSGLPEADPRHAANVMELAMAMIETVGRIRAESHLPIRIRIGVNTGPVIAGIIGRKRFLYDLWGDAVNTASRMESHGEADTIQVSSGTYEALKDEYEFQSLGAIEVKGKGRLPAWRLVGRHGDSTAG